VTVEISQQLQRLDNEKNIVSEKTQKNPDTKSPSGYIRLSDAQEVIFYPAETGTFFRNVGHCLHVRCAYGVFLHF